MTMQEASSVRRVETWKMAVAEVASAYLATKNGQNVGGVNVAEAVVATALNPNASANPSSRRSCGSRASLSNSLQMLQCVTVPQ